MRARDRECPRLSRQSVPAADPSLAMRAEQGQRHVTNRPDDDVGVGGSWRTIVVGRRTELEGGWRWSARAATAWASWPPAIVSRPGGAGSARLCVAGLFRTGSPALRRRTRLS